MPTSRLVDARKWIKGFENDTLESNCLAPGTTIKPHDRFKDRELTSWMCGIEADKILTLLYGPPNGKVSGKVKKSFVSLFRIRRPHYYRHLIKKLWYQLAFVYRIARQPIWPSYVYFL